MDGASARIRDVLGLEVVSATPLTDGLLNQTWRLHGADHDRVLRISRAGRTLAQVEYEQRAARAWQASVPQVVVAEAEPVLVDGRVLTLFPFVPGVSGTTIDPTRRSQTMGAVLARLHRSSLDLGLPQRPGFAALDERPHWHGWATARALVRAAHPDREVRAAVDLLDAELARLDALVAEWSAAGRLALRATVHGDLNPRNQLWDGDELVGVIDTDDCRVDPLVWEVAQTVYGDRSVPPDTVWRSYRDAGGPVPESDRDLLEPLAWIGAMSELQWLLADGVEPAELAPEARTTLLTVAGWVGLPVARDG